MQARRRRSRRRGARRGGTPGRGLVIGAHLASLLSVAALVTGLTVGSIAMARRCIGSDAASGFAATAPEDGMRSRTGTTEPAARSSR